MDSFTEFASDDINNTDALSIFDMIRSALDKANLDDEDINYLLFIGGSCKSPYIQHSLNEYFDSSTPLVPCDLQKHVSIGTAIHSLVLNRNHENIIQPITNEPVIIITNEGRQKVLVPAGTEIPLDWATIDKLTPQKDGQKVIEIPICLSSKDQILSIIKVNSPTTSGFPGDTQIELKYSFSIDKDFQVEAYINGKKVASKQFNPYANKPLTDEERKLHQVIKATNQNAVINGGKPDCDSLVTLANAYSKTSNYLKAAETLELGQQLYPHRSLENNIGIYYASAGREDKHILWLTKAYENDKSPTIAFNLALYYQYSDTQKFEKLMQEALTLNPEHTAALHVYGKYLIKKHDPKGEQYVQTAFDIMKRQLESDTLHESDYSRLKSCAEQLGDLKTVKKINAAIKKVPAQAYSNKNLVIAKY
jgi:hypothetical protein